MKLLVAVNSKKLLENTINKNIDGIIIYLDKLSVNSSFFMNIDEILNTDFNNKEVFICINKIMHNNDLNLLESSLLKLKNTNYKILFYDMGVYNISKKLNMVDKLVIYQDHLNSNSISSNFYYDLGITGAYINSDITYEELNQIKKNSKSFIMTTVYGYIPIFYSRRYLLTNYFKYIGATRKDTNYYLDDNGDRYHINEEEHGTTIYTKDKINLINRLDDISDIDYFVINSNMCENIEEIIDKFINREKMDNCYIGFFDTKTIYRVKGE